MADHYVYVDPVSGNDGTGAGNDNATTAAGTPYKTLVAAVSGAISAGEADRVSKSGAIHFRLLDGLDAYTGASTAGIVVIANATWNTSATYPIKIYGYGSGVHNGNLHDTGTGAGYTIKRTVTGSGNKGAVIETDGYEYVEITDIRIHGYSGVAEEVDGFRNTSSYGAHTLNRLLIYIDSTSAACDGVYCGGGATAARAWSLKNSVAVVKGGVAVNARSYGNATITHNTIVGLGSAIGLYVNNNDTACTIKFNYAHSSAGAAFSGNTGIWDVVTRERNASSDTTAYHATYDPNGLNSIAYTTTNFTNVTGGSEDLRLASGSALINAASTSSETVDVEGTSRSTPDIGAYEFVSAAGHPAGSRARGIPGMNQISSRFGRGW